MGWGIEQLTNDLECPQCRCHVARTLVDVFICAGKWWNPRSEFFIIPCRRIVMEDPRGSFIAGGLLAPQWPRLILRNKWEPINEYVLPSCGSSDWKRGGKQENPRSCIFHKRYVYPQKAFLFKHNLTSISRLGFRRAAILYVVVFGIEKRPRSALSRADFWCPVEHENFPRE
jgi:hypothetical protein